MLSESVPGIEFSVIQKNIFWKKNSELRTIVGVAEGLNISLAELFSHCDKVTEKEINVENEKWKKKEEEIISDFFV